jgi:uncharacterized protein (DUF1697 family)
MPETTCIALLRGINVTGHGILAMKDLSALCVDLGFGCVRTYIQSGNVVFRSRLASKATQARLEEALEKQMGKKVAVMLRNAQELEAVLRANPFTQENPSKVGVHFLHEPPAKDFLERVIAPGAEQVRLGVREVYVYFPEGMGRTKLRLPLKPGAFTVRNINTVGKLVELSRLAAEEAWPVKRRGAAPLRDR